MQSQGAMASPERTQNQNQSEKEQDDSSSYALQLSFSSILPLTLDALIHLGIFKIIAGARGAGADAEADVKVSPQEIARRLGTQNPDAPLMLDRILRLLASHNVVTCSIFVDENNDPHRLYGLAPVCKYFVKNKDGVSLGPLMTSCQDKVVLDAWSQLKHAVMEGGSPFERVHGTHAYDYLARDSRFNQVFNKAMINHSGIVMKEIVEAYKGFEHISRLVDVGGGSGVALSLIVSKYPSVKGTNFDLPHVIQHAPSCPGVEHIGGDMFQNIPKGDAIFMKWILHNWNDDHCVKLLRNCYNAIPCDGILIVVDAIAPVQPEQDATSKYISHLDMLMMTVIQGGKERTQQEFMSLATKAGFNGIRLICFVFNSCVMEFFK